MKYLLVVLSCISIMGCKTLDVFEKSMNITNMQWSSNNTAKVEFDITDTSSMYEYFLVIRHANNYPFKNIWLEINNTTPKENITFKKEFTLADNEKWLGTKLENIVEHRLSFNPNAIRLPKGKHSFTLKQIMRLDPLPNILSVGIRVQKK